MIRAAVNHMYIIRVFRVFRCLKIRPPCRSAASSQLSSIIKITGIQYK